MYLYRDICVSRPAMTLNVYEHLYLVLLEIIKLAYLLQNCFWSVSERTQNANRTQPKRKSKLASYSDCWVTASTSVSMTESWQCTQNATPKRSQSVRLSAALLQNATQNAKPKRKAKHAKSIFVRGLPNLNRKLVSVRGCRKNECLISE